MCSNGAALLGCDNGGSARASQTDSSTIKKSRYLIRQVSSGSKKQKKVGSLKSVRWAMAISADDRVAEALTPNPSVSPSALAMPRRGEFHGRMTEFAPCSPYSVPCRSVRKPRRAAFSRADAKKATRHKEKSQGRPREPVFIAPRRKSQLLACQALAAEDGLAERRPAGVLPNKREFPKPLWRQAVAAHNAPLPVDLLDNIL